jgi:hypothetical protein
VALTLALRKAAGVTGNMEGDGFQLGGTFLLERGTGKILWEYRQKSFEGAARTRTLWRAAQQMSEAPRVRQTTPPTRRSSRPWMRCLASKRAQTGAPGCRGLCEGPSLHCCSQRGGPDVEDRAVVAQSTQPDAQPNEHEL